VTAASISKFSAQFLDYVASFFKSPDTGKIGTLLRQNFGTLQRSGSNL